MWATIIREPWYQKWKFKWKLQLTLRIPKTTQTTGTSMVAVNLGWRLMKDHTLRVATWADDEGNTGEIRLDESFRNRIVKSEQIRSIRDMEMNALRDLLVESGVNCSKWKSFKRFHILLKQKDLNLDSDVVELLKAWAYRDNHLWWYERGCRRGALNYRRQIYRDFARSLAEKYDIIVVEDYDLRDIVVDENRQKEPSAQRVESAPSVARQIIRSTGARLGRVIIDGESKQATQRCHICGDEEPWDAAPDIMHTCTNGHTWDQDINNARNMLSSALVAVQHP